MELSENRSNINVQPVISFRSDKYLYTWTRLSMCWRFFVLVFTLYGIIKMKEVFTNKVGPSFMEYKNKH